MNVSWIQPIKGALGERAPELAGATLFLLLVLLVFFWPAVFGGRVLLPADLVFDLDPLWQPLAPQGYAGPSNALLADQVYQFHPWQAFLRAEISRGQLPLWNPHTDGGLPFVGNAQSAIFSPFSLAGYLVPLYSSYVITAILRLLLAGVFTFLFAREISIGIPGALVAMLTFTFSGPMIAWLGHPHSLVIAWLPAVLYTTERALTRRSPSYIGATGLIIGAQFLGGHPETSLHLMLAWAAYALYRIVSIEGWHTARWFPHLLGVGAAAALGVIIAAVQLLPFAEALFRSATLAVRSSEASAEATLSITSLLGDWRQWATIITTLLPQYFGTSLDDSYWFPHSNYVEQNAYVGVLPLVLAIVILVRNLRPPFSQHRSRILFFGATAAVSLGIALRLPGLNVMNTLPLLSLTANGRLRLIYAFAMAVLAGFGANEINTQTWRSRLSAQRVLLALTVAMILLICATYAGLVIFRDEVIHSGRSFMEANWSTTPYLSGSLEYYYDLVEERYQKKLALFHLNNITMYLPLLVTLAWIALRNRLGEAGLSDRVSPWTISAVVIFDLFAVGMRFNPTVEPHQVFPTPKAIECIQQDQDIHRVSGTDLTLYPNSAMLFGLHDVRGYDTVVPQRYVDLVDRLNGHFRFHFHSLFRETNSPLWDLLNVQYVLTDQDLDGKWELACQGNGTVKVYRNRDVVPRAFVVHRAEVVDSPRQSLERILSPSFDFREEAVLEEELPRWVEPSAESTAEASAHVMDYQPNRVTIDVQTASDGLLVLTDTYAPGWKALLDGEPVPVYVADHAFRAVVVPTGSHRITLVYQPRSFYAGAIITLLGLAAIGAVFLAPWVKCSTHPAP